MSLADRKKLPYAGGLPPPEPGFEWVFDPNTFEPWQRKKDEPPLNSVAIQRIIDEVKVEKDAPLAGYNRTYSRHNR
jgi:hypothetical protein